MVRSLRKFFGQTLLDAGLAVSVIAIIGCSFVSLGPLMDKWLRPPVSAVEAVLVKPVAGGSLIETVQWDKNRECRFLTQDHYIGTPSGASSWIRNVDTDWHDRNTQGRAPSYPVGRVHSGGWFVGVDPETLVEETYIVVEHDCDVLWTPLRHRIRTVWHLTDATVLP